MSTLQIQQAMAGQVVPSKDGRYQIHSFMVNGTLDGAPVQGITVKCFSDKAAAEVGPGKTLEVTGKEYNGQMEYTFRLGGSGSGSGGSWGGRPRVQYTQAEYEALFRRAIEFVRKAAAPEQETTFASLVATYLIGARDSGVKIEAPQTPAQKTAAIMQAPVQLPPEMDKDLTDADIPFS